MNRYRAADVLHNSIRSKDAENTLSHAQIAETLDELNNKTPDLRDYFAVAALQTLAELNVEISRIARTAYQIADAMLEAREK